MTRESKLPDRNSSIIQLVLKTQIIWGYCVLLYRRKVMFSLNKSIHFHFNVFERL